MKNRYLQVLAASAIAALFGAATATLATESTTLPNGAELSVTLDTPPDNGEYGIPAAIAPGGGTADVVVSGEASIGEGEAAVTLVVAVDVSGSTDAQCGINGKTVLDCEKDAVLNLLNDANIQSVKDVGIVVFGTNGAAADMEPTAGDQLVTDPNATPGDPTVVVGSIGGGGVTQYTPRTVGGGSTNFTAGVQAAIAALNAGTGATKILAFLSDGQASAITNGAALAATGATAFTYAIGSGSSCTGGLASVSNATPGGTCTFVPNPANFPEVLPNLIGTVLQEVAVSVDGTPTGTTTTDDALQADGPLTTGFSDTATSLAAGEHSICAEATGSDKADPPTTLSVEECADIDVLQLIASPETETNECGTEHTVTASLLGTGSSRNINFEVSGANTASGSSTATPGGSAVPFTYAQNDPSNLGDDTIQVSTLIGGSTSAVDLQKTWVDTTPPVITCPADITLECTGPTGATAEYDATATDICDASVIPTCAPPSGSTFALGTTTVSCSATDASANSSSCPFQVKVEDTTAPTIADVSADPSVLWPPNHKMKDVTVSVDVTDVCDAAPSCEITAITSNEDDNGIGDGNTTDDAVITGALTAELRAERSGPGEGRVYTIEVTCTDADGNSTTDTTEVSVPHDQGKKK